MSLVKQYRPIYRLLLSQVGHDFSGYKDKTFMRRVQRRMQVVGLTRLEDYLTLLNRTPTRSALLFRDLLISVTNFFRDPEAFQALSDTGHPDSCSRARAPPMRCASGCPGCATGEEVYSIAMLLREHLAGMRAPPRCRSSPPTSTSRRSPSRAPGAIPRPLLDDVSPERRRRFFVADGVSYVVRKEMRDLCIFSPHSVIRDPPFSRIDLISCRNLLIYLGGELQNQVIPVFHFALRPRRLPVPRHVRERQRSTAICSPPSTRSTGSSSGATTGHAAAVPVL